MNYSSLNDAFGPIKGNIDFGRGGGVKGGGKEGSKKFCDKVSNDYIEKLRGRGGKSSCIRKCDGKEFDLPRKFSKKKCLAGVKGFTMKSSCSPFIKCSKGGGVSGGVRGGVSRGVSGGSNGRKKKNSKKKKKVERFVSSSDNSNDSRNKNMLGEKLENCSLNPKTGWDRSGKCKLHNDDTGNHLVCAEMDKEFMDFTAGKNNDLSSVVSSGENWCLCQLRWMEAAREGKAPKVILNATNNAVKGHIKKEIRKNNKLKYNIEEFVGRRGKGRGGGGVGVGGGGKGVGRGNGFLYNKKNPGGKYNVYSKNYISRGNVYPVKYSSIREVIKLIKDLEKQYKKGVYSHKEIGQKAMIVRVRLKIMIDKRLGDLNDIRKRHDLIFKYCEFLKERTGIKNEVERKKMVFEF